MCIYIGIIRINLNEFLVAADENVLERIIIFIHIYIYTLLCVDVDEESAYLFDIITYIILYT